MGELRGKALGSFSWHQNIHLFTQHILDKNWFSIIRQHHIYSVQIGLLKASPALEEAGVCALIPSTDSKAKLQTEFLQKENRDHRQRWRMLSEQQPLLAAFYHGAAWEETNSLLWGNHWGKVCRQAQKSRKQSSETMGSSPSHSQL